MLIIPLHRGPARIPDFDGPIFRTGDHPFPLAMEGDARDVAGVAFEDMEGGRVRGADVVELDVVVAGGGEEAFVGGDAEAVDL